jgi:hypothetical protein
LDDPVLENSEDYCCDMRLVQIRNEPAPSEIIPEVYI